MKRVLIGVIVLCAVIASCGRVDSKKCATPCKDTCTTVAVDSAKVSCDTIK